MDVEARKRQKAHGLRGAERLNALGVDVYCSHADTGAMVEETANRLSTGRLRVHDQPRGVVRRLPALSPRRRATSPRPTII